MKFLNKALNIFDKFIATISVISILTVFVVIVVQVIVRKLGGTMSWADELCRYLTLIMVFFGAARSARVGDTIRVDFLLERLNPKIHRWIEVVMQLIVLAFMCLFAYSLYLGIGTLGTQTLGILTNVRLSTIYWIIFASIILLILNTLLHVIDIAQKGLPEKEEEEANIFCDEATIKKEVK